jgi:hypothetical protein
MDIQNYTKEKPKADVYIWCKIANLDEMKAQKANGAKVVWDLCDPVHWWSPGKARQIMGEVDHIVCSNQALAYDTSLFSGMKVDTIADRIELEHYPVMRKHERVDPVRFIWYGAGQNRFTLLGALANLERLVSNGINIELTVYDDRPDNILRVTDSFPVYHTKWELRNENKVIAAHDIAILPDYPGAWGKVKSNNKMLTAWACGVPVSSGELYEPLYHLASITQDRRDQAENGYKLLVDKYDVRQSAVEWKELLK